MTTPDAGGLSVVIPTLGNHATLRRALASYEVQRAPADAFEVVVVADAAEPDPDAVAATVAGRPYPARMLRAETPGASAARNEGWRAARHPLVLFTDNDILADRRLVAEHLAWHRRHPEEQVAVLGHVRWARELSVTPFMRWLDHGIQFDYPAIAGTDAGWGRFYTSNVSVKTSLLERLGGFDAERLPYRYEDVDFGYRAGRAGMRLLYARRAVAEHLGVPDLETWRRKVRTIAYAERDFVRIHPELPPYYQRRFAEALSHPPASGRGVPLLRFIPRRLPWLGERVWASAERYFDQQLAEPFLAAWEEAWAELGTDPPATAAGEDSAQPGGGDTSAESAARRRS